MRKVRLVRSIGDVMKWSPQCREHFFPWLTKGADILSAHAIAEAGITECHPGYRLERSAPRFHLLVYPTLGQGEVFDTIRNRRVVPGQILIAPAHRPFGYRPASRTWRFMWFHLPDDDAWTFLRKDTFTIRKTLLTNVLSTVTEGFLQESRGRSESHGQASSLYAGLISVYVKRELVSGAPDLSADMGNRLDHLCALVNADLAHPWSVDSLAEAVGVSCSHLHRLVMERYGTSPMKLVTRLRMERAQEWLILHDAPQGIIGEKVGYQNEFAFLVAFKRYSGVTPKEFRKRR